MPTTYAIIKGNQYFDATLYTGNGGTQSIVNSGSMQPDLVWIKTRSNALSHCITDAVRGTNLQLASNSTGGDQSTTDGITAFNSNGFTLGAGTQQYSSNTNTYTYVGWQWRASNAAAVTNTDGSLTSTVSANTTSGFSIVTYTGTNNQETIGHGLGAVPAMIIVKARSGGTENWAVYNKNIGAANKLFLNLTNASTATGNWQSTTPTSTVFYVDGSSTSVNASGWTYVAYCWSEIAGFSKFGSYTGNGSTDGPFIYTGFRPAYLLIKNTTTGSTDWVAIDDQRLGYNVTDVALNPNANYAENSGYATDLVSNGFKIRTTTSYMNSNGSTYIYAAFAEMPTKYANAR